MESQKFMHNNAKPKRFLCKYVTEIKLKKLILLRTLQYTVLLFLVQNAAGFPWHKIFIRYSRHRNAKRWFVLTVHVILFETKLSFKISSFHTIMASPLYWFALYIMQCVLIVMYINNDKYK